MISYLIRTTSGAAPEARVLAARFEAWSAVDWAVADTELLTIRARTASSHALTVEPDGRDKWRIINVVIAMLLLGVVMVVGYLRKRGLEPIVVAERRGA